MLSPPGRLLDATKKYMYVFLLAGCEVTLSAFVLALGNYFCIGRKQEDPEAKLEMAVTTAEMEGLNHREEEDEQREEEPKGKENGKTSGLNEREEGREENTELSL